MSDTFDISYNRFNRVVLGLLGMGPRHSGVAVGDDTVEVRMGWSFRSLIERSAIVSIEPDDDRVWGWGVHGWRDRWLVNGSSRGIVRITIDPPVESRIVLLRLRLRVLRVGVADRDALLAALAPAAA